MMTIKKLIELKEILNVYKLAEKANINPNTLYSKIINNRELNVVESMEIGKVLQQHKIIILDD